MVLRGIGEAAVVKSKTPLALAIKIKRLKSLTIVIDETSQKKKKENTCSGKKNHQSRKLMIFRSLILKSTRNQKMGLVRRKGLLLKSELKPICLTSSLFIHPMGLLEEAAEREEEATEAHEEIVEVEAEEGVVTKILEMLSTILMTRSYSLSSLKNLKKGSKEVAGEKEVAEELEAIMVVVAETNKEAGQEKKKTNSPNQMKTEHVKLELEEADLRKKTKGVLKLLFQDNKMIRKAYLMLKIKLVEVEENAEVEDVEVIAKDKEAEGVKEQTMKNMVNLERIFLQNATKIVNISKVMQEVEVRFNKMKLDNFLTKPTEKEGQEVKT